VTKCRIDSFRLSMCHMFLLNVEFSNACRFRVFECHFSTVSRFPFPRFQLPKCWHRRTEYWKLPAFLPNIQNVVINFSGWQCLCTLLGPISLLYKQLLQYTLLQYFTVPFALMTKFPKKFHTKLLESDIIFTKLSTKTLLFDAAVFHLSIKGYCKTRPHRSHCFLSMLKINCKRHYRNLATHSWYTTRREHVTKAAPTRRRHSVGGGGVAAAAHSSNPSSVLHSTCDTARTTYSFG